MVPAERFIAAQTVDEKTVRNKGAEKPKPSEFPDPLTCAQSAQGTRQELQRRAADDFEVKCVTKPVPELHSLLPQFPRRRGRNDILLLQASGNLAALDYSLLNVLLGNPRRICGCVPPRGAFCHWRNKRSREAGSSRLPPRRHARRNDLHCHLASPA
jgi:hypothetical protein